MTRAMIMPFPSGLSLLGSDIKFWYQEALYVEFLLSTLLLVDFVKYILHVKQKFLDTPFI